MECLAYSWDGVVGCIRYVTFIRVTFELDITFCGRCDAADTRLSDVGLVSLQESKCCGVLPAKSEFSIRLECLILSNDGYVRRLESSPTRTIPYFNVLSAELNELELTIHHATPLSSSQSSASPTLRVSTIHYMISKADIHAAEQWIQTLLTRAYVNSQQHRRIKVLINPFGGSGAAAKRYSRDIEPIFTAARCVVDVERTAYRSHAREIAQNIDINAFDVIASCSGDGLPHEVFNGLGDKHNAAEALRKVAVVQLPCGTGNAMSWNLNGTDSPSLAALCIVKGIRTPLDLVSITQGPPGQERRTLSFLSQSVGIVAETDLGTENVRWMGDLRFTYGFLVRLLGKTVYPCQLSVKVVEDDKQVIRARCNSYRTDEQPKRDDTATGFSQGTTSDSQTDTLDQGVVPPQQNGLPPLQHGTVNTPLSSSWPPLKDWPTMGNFYSGNMGYMSRDANFFQAALPSDGCLDLVCIDGTIPRLSSVKSLVAVSDGTFFDMPYVQYRKVEAYRIVPKGAPRSGPWPGEESTNDKSGGVRKGKKDGYISIDGEHFPFEPFQVEVHRALGTVISLSGKTYEIPPLQ